MIGQKLSILHDMTEAIHNMLIAQPSTKRMLKEFIRKISYLAIIAGSFTAFA